MRAYFCDNCRDWVPDSGKRRCAGCGEPLGDASPKLLTDGSEAAQGVVNRAEERAVNIAAAKAEAARLAGERAVPEQAKRPSAAQTAAARPALKCLECGAVVNPGAAFCHRCGAAVSWSADMASGNADSLVRVIRTLEARVAALEADADENARLLDNHYGGLEHVQDRLEDIQELLGSSGVFSESFWTRSWAIFWNGAASGFVIQGIYIFMILVLLGVASLGR